MNGSAHYASHVCCRYGSSYRRRGSPFFSAPLQAQAIRFGSAAVTWGNKEREAVDDIAAAGYAGIQFRANTLRLSTPLS
jgi:hypothetical protein